MFRKLLIALILFVIVASVLLGGAWYMSRRTAQKSGTTPPTFREFLTLGNKSSNTAGKNNLSSLFTSEETKKTPDENKNLSDSNTNVGGITPDVSTFTNGTINPTLGGAPLDLTGPTIGTGSPISSGPTIGTGTPTVSNGGIYTGSTDTPNSTPTTGSNDTPTNGGVTPSTLACSDEDTNISFTQTELDELRNLQTRFNTLSRNLHTDGDVRTEFANYEGFKVEEAEIKEMTQFCQNKTPQLASALYRRHVPTPFWRDPTKDVATFYPAPSGGVNNTIMSSLSIPAFQAAILERLLRISFW